MSKFNENFTEQQHIDWGYTILNIDKKDIVFSDIVNNVFNETKYNSRKTKEENETKIAELKAELEELTKDFAQVNAGLVIDNIEEKKVEFQTKLNEIRVLQGKEPRSIKE